MESLNSVIYSVASDGTYMFADGEIDFNDIRTTLENDFGFDEDSERGYEVWVRGNWNGYEAFALLESDGYILASQSYRGIEELVKRIERESGLLNDAEEDLLLKQILEAVKDGWRVHVTSSPSGCPRCTAWGAAFNNGDEESVKADFTLIFNSDRVAESQAEDFDDVADYVEGISFWGDSEGNVDEVESDGELVRITADIFFTDGEASSPPPSSTGRRRRGWAYARSCRH